MATIDRQLVQHVAELASLALSEEEVDFFQAKLSEIVEFFAQINQIPDNLGDDWRGDIQGSPTPERVDTVHPSLSPEDALASAPKVIGTAFQVPRIIE